MSAFFNPGARFRRMNLKSRQRVLCQLLTGFLFTTNRGNRI
jgi:hypothetical protein